MEKHSLKIYICKTNLYRFIAKTWKSHIQTHFIEIQSHHKKIFFQLYILFFFVSSSIWFWNISKTKNIIKTIFIFLFHWMGKWNWIYWFVYWVVLFSILGIHILFSNSERSLLDLIFIYGWWNCICKIQLILLGSFIYKSK